jgi:hypothetical protein
MTLISKRYKFYKVHFLYGDVKMKKTIALSLLIGFIAALTFSNIIQRTVQVISPNGGEKYYKGSTVKIKWSCTPAKGTGKLFLTKQRKGIVAVVHTFSVKSSSGENHEFNWKIPSDIPAGSDYKIGVEVKYSTMKRTDYSDRFFTIDALEVITEVAAPRIFARIRIISPNGGEIVYKGENYLVEWETPDSIGRPRLSLRQGEDFVHDIFGLTPEGPLSGDRYRYNWHVPPEVPNDNCYKLRIEAATMRGFDDSDRCFTVTDQKILITRPTDGQRIRRGSSITINFNAINITQNLKVWVDGLNPAYTIAENLPPTTTSVVWPDVPVVDGVIPGGNSVRIVVSTMDLSVKATSGWIIIYD